MTESIELHPVVARLAASLSETSDGLRVTEMALEDVRAALRTDTDAVTTHLLAWLFKVVRIAGPDAAEPIRVLVLELIRAQRRAEAAARDAWEQAEHLARAQPKGAALVRRTLGTRTFTPTAPVTRAARGLGARSSVGLN